MVRKRQSANDAASLLHCAKCVFDKCRLAADTLSQSSSNKILWWALFYKAEYKVWATCVITILKEVKIPQLCSKNRWTLDSSFVVLVSVTGSAEHIGHVGFQYLT